MKFSINEEEKKEFAYQFTLNVSFEVEYDSSDDSDVTEIFEDEIRDEKRELMADVTASLDKALKEKDIGVNEVTYDDDDVDGDTAVVYCTVFTDKEYDIDSISKILEEVATNISKSEEMNDMEYDGDFIGYAQGWNYPDAGGPPEYSDESADITVTIYVDDVTDVEVYSE